MPIFCQLYYQNAFKLSYILQHAAWHIGSEGFGELVCTKRDAHAASSLACMFGSKAQNTEGHRNCK